RAGSYTSESSHAALDEGSRVLARLHRRCRRRPASGRHAGEAGNGPRDRRGATRVVRRHDPHDRSPVFDTSGNARRKADRRPAISRRDGARAPGGRMSEEWRVAVGDDHTRAVYEPAATDNQVALFIMAHGAGGNMSDRAMLAAANALRARGFGVVRFNFLYK